MEQNPHTALLRDRYTAALLAGDDEEAHRVAGDALDRGIGPAEIYFEIFAPALAAVGASWRRGELNIAAEHLATGATLRQIAHVGEVWRRKRRRDNGLKAVMAAVEGEMHSIGVRMLADLFHVDGWSVVDLGPDNPTDDLVKLVEERKPDLVVLSLSSPGRIRAARQLLGPGSGRVSLEAHLDALGRRILELRKERGWSQQELADRASLDRTYISAVEKGRQNITIGAAVRIADALETSLSSIIDDS